MQPYKKQKKRYHLCLFLFSNNIDFKNNTRNYEKAFLKFMGARIAAISSAAKNFVREGPVNDVQSLTSS